MGRLFWKFLLAFWSTLLVAALGVGLAVRSYERATRDTRTQAAADPRAGFLVDGAAATLRHGGPATLRALLAEQAGRPAERVYAIDADGRDLLGRAVPAEALALAGDRASAGHGPHAARRVQAADGGVWLLVAEADPSRAPPVGGPPHAPDLFFPPRPRPAPGEPPGAPPAATPGELAPLEPPPRHGPPPPLLSLATGLIAGLGFSALLAWYVSRPIAGPHRARGGASRSADRPDADPVQVGSRH